jgi:hypothetical protein
MSNIQLSAIEKEMANFNFDELNAHKESAKANIKTAASIADVKTEICQVWSKIRKYVVLAEAIPVVGKFITILAELLDSICAA